MKDHGKLVLFFAFTCFFAISTFGKSTKADTIPQTIKIIGDDEYKLNAIIDVLKGKMVKRNVAIKNLDYGKVEPAAGATVRQIITIKKGITKENAKEVVKAIKNMKLKVQASIQEDQVRVSGKDKDDLQQVIQMLKQLDVPVELQFVNFRS